MHILPNPLSKKAARTRATLQRIADALGIHIGAFWNGNSDHADAQVEELLRLWLALKSEQDRQKVLAFLRGLNTMRD